MTAIKVFESLLFIVFFAQLYPIRRVGIGLPYGSKGRFVIGKQSGASQTYPYFQWQGLHSHEKKSDFASSLLRNKAKNALSLAAPISLGIAGAKIRKKWFVQRRIVGIPKKSIKFPIWEPFVISAS